MPWGRERGAGVSPPRGHPQHSPETPPLTPREPTRAWHRARCPKSPWHRVSPSCSASPCRRWLGAGGTAHVGVGGTGALRVPILHTRTHSGAGGLWGDPQPPPQPAEGGFQPCFWGPKPQTPTPWQRGQQAAGGGSVTASTWGGGSHATKGVPGMLPSSPPPLILPSPLPPTPGRRG